jgi:hypothetical protein
LVNTVFVHPDSVNPVDTNPHLVNMVFVHPDKTSHYSIFLAKLGITWHNSINLAKLKHTFIFLAKLGITP